MVWELAGGQHDLDIQTLLTSEQVGLLSYNILDVLMARCDTGSNVGNTTEIWQLIPKQDFEKILKRTFFFCSDIARFTG